MQKEHHSRVAATGYLLNNDLQLRGPSLGRFIRSYWVCGILNILIMQQFPFTHLQPLFFPRLSECDSNHIGCSSKALQRFSEEITGLHYLLIQLYAMKLLKNVKLPGVSGSRLPDGCHLESSSHISIRKSAFDYQRGNPLRPRAHFRRSSSKVWH